MTQSCDVPDRLAGNSDNCLLGTMRSWSRIVEALVRLA